MGHVQGKIQGDIQWSRYISLGSLLAVWYVFILASVLSIALSIPPLEFIRKHH